MLVLAYWLFCAIICAMIAKEKNRSVIIWFVVGLLFNLFAVLIIAVISKGEK